MWSVKNYIIVYLDTGLIPRPKGIEKPKKEIEFLLKELFNLSNEGKITLRSTQGSLDDIFGANNERVNSQAEERYKQMQLTEPVAETILESNEDFSDDDIELFNIMFPSENVFSGNIYQCFLDLKENDRNDFRIIKSCIEDSNSYAFFLTQNKNDFIKNGRKQDLEYVITNKYRKHLEIGELNEDMLKKVKYAIQEVTDLLS
ncbi:hypothetical protein [Solibacillus isronensis]|uniref:hypothetical protein n=1 Tax=Solibacillus isronensis TaxID=412383 RepID=UPI0009A6B0C1|nr:hypothetical protein [Solibacillus isronensis]